MIDLHCHILPGVDDGAADPETSCDMAQMAADSGVQFIVATPHCNLPGGPHNYCSERLLEKFDALDHLFQYYRIPVRVLPGAEVLVRDNFFRLLQEKKFITINHSRYLLVEFVFNAAAAYMTQALEQIHSVGLVPVVAHPERYDAIQRDPMLAARWFHSGYILQVNKGSLLGRLGRSAYGASVWLLNRGLVHVVASDAHSVQVRTPNMNLLTDFLQEHCPASYVRILLEENPSRIIHNLPIPIPGKKE